MKEKIELILNIFITIISIILSIIFIVSNEIITAVLFGIITILNIIAVVIRIKSINNKK